MTQEVPETPWIHIGECPVCVNGLCRVRYCVSESDQPHCYALCDECEATWLNPTTDDDPTFPDAEQPRCPVCGRPMFGSQAHWARSEELAGTPWGEVAIFEVPSAMIDEETSPPAENFLTTEDALTALDAPPDMPTAPPVHHPDGLAPLHADSAPLPPSDDTDNADQDDLDEPQPGC